LFGSLNLGGGQTRIEKVFDWVGFQFRGFDLEQFGNKNATNKSCRVFTQ